MAKTASRQATIFINGKQIENTLQGVRAAWSQVNNELNLLIIGTEEYEAKMKELQKLDGILADHRAALKGTAQGYSLLQSGVASFVAVAAGAFTVDTIVAYGKELFGTATRMEQMEKKAKTVFAETLPSITREAEKNAAAMGLTTAQYIEQAAGIQDLLVPMGFQRQEAVGITAQLVNLSGALSEWSGGQVSAEQVSERLSAALLGERESLKELGIAISQADVDARVAANGQKELTGKYKEQAEAAATLQLILEKSTDAQAAYAANADSSIRTQAELAARFQEVSEKLAVALIPVFERLLTVAADVADGLNWVAEAVGDIADPVGAATKAFDDQAAKVSDLETNMVPLLDRYDELQEKGTLNKKEQDELNRIIQKVSETVPSAVTAFDQYGRALGLNTDKAREFVEVEKARLQFVNQAAIKATEDQIAALEKQVQQEQYLLASRQKTVTQQSTTGFGFVSASVALTDEELNAARARLAELNGDGDKFAGRLAGAKAELARLKGETIQVAETPKSSGGTGGGGLDEKAAEKAQKELEKREKDLAAHLAKVQAMVELHDEENRLRELAKDQQDIERIRAKYETEIAEAREKFTDQDALKTLTAQLELQRDAEIFAKTEEQKKAQALAREQREKEEYDRTQAFLLERDAARKAADDALAAFKVVTDDQKRLAELAALDVQYAAMLAKAEEFGRSEADITAAYNAKKDAINKASADKQIEFQRAVAEAETGLAIARAGAFEQGAALLAGFFEQNSAMANLLFLVEKTAAIASLVINFQKERAAIWANATASPANILFPGYAAAVAVPQVSAARLRMGFGIATIAATSIQKFIAPKTKQKFGGGLLPVTGETDGQRYLAQAIATPNTGLLPHFPVLFQSGATGAPVLASERGAEYFVAAHDLRRPAVANLVRMIDLLTQRGGAVRQFADGGANLPADNQPPAQTGLDMAVLRELAGAVKSLNTILASGRVIATVPDQTVVDISDRLKVLGDVSGGYYG